MNNLRRNAMKLRHIRDRALFFLLIWVALYPSQAPALSRTLIAMEVGGSKFISTGPITRIAVGDSQIAQVSATGSEGILIFGKTRGDTHVDIWAKNGTHRSFKVTVSPRGFEATYIAVKQLLNGIAGLDVSKAGDKIVLTGSNVSDHDKRRIAQMTALYPDVLDLTSAMGWDRMILLDVLVLELPSARLQELGLKWNVSSDSGFNSALGWEMRGQKIETAPAIQAASVRSAGPMMAVNALVSARIDALSKNGEAAILAQPQLLTRSGSPANFLAGGEVPYTSTDKDGRVNTHFKKYGVSLSITPQANGLETVRSNIEIEVSSVDPTISSPNGPAMRVRRASTEFNVKSGQTLILGGFISREKSHEWEGIPGASEIPILRSLFGTERTHERQIELAILVTPHIVDPSLVGSDARIVNVQDVIDERFRQSPSLDGLTLNRPVVTTESLQTHQHSTDQWED